MKIKPVYVEGTTLDDVWFRLLYELKEKGRVYDISSGSYEGSRRLAFDDVSGFVHFPHERPLAPIMPEGVPVPTTQLEIENYFIKYLMNGELEANEDYRYSLWVVGGKYDLPKGVTFDTTVSGVDKNDRRTLKFPVIVPNQIEWIIKHFKEKGYGNEHCYLTVGYPESNFAYDIPYFNPNERRTSPCLRGLDFRIIQEDGINYLTTKVIYRSWDLWGGWPTNMGGFTMLNEYVAGELDDVEAGPLSFACKSLHCYEHHLEVLRLRLNATNWGLGTK